MTQMPPGRGPNAAAEANKRSSLLFWLGCASVALILLLVAVGVTMMIMLRKSQASSAGGEARARAMLPADWRATLRTLQVPPEADRLAPPRTDSGNAVVALHDVRMQQPYPIVYARLARRLTIDSSDLPLVAALLRDPTADRIAAAARMRTYDVTPVLFNDRDSLPIMGVNLPVISYYWGGGSRIELLLARGVARERAGRLDAAREDYRAALGLGAMMARGEVGLSGWTVGLRYFAEAATSLRASAGRDTALAAAAGRLVDWSNAARLDGFRIVAAMVFVQDSALAAVRDTTLPLWVRGEAIHAAGTSFLNAGAWQAYRGPSRDAYAIVHAAEHDANPTLAALAVKYDTGMARLDRVGGVARLRWYMRARRM